ncbi:hypothetical protein LAZ67_18001995 [Cordylochernes scorpioides]|uniref:Reverse transcriptase domain-containing protein n=1 Tax=Cordylochernes scorpioides TaxID=51811 RepID=A0ABY6LG87_9ARAC|nr:hypothetical protein LAZ67_18001995 [Cordylochernes scorpioides]
MGTAPPFWRRHLVYTLSLPLFLRIVAADSGRAVPPSALLPPPLRGVRCLLPAGSPAVGPPPPCPALGTSWPNSVAERLLILIPRSSRAAAYHPPNLRRAGFTALPCERWPRRPPPRIRWFARPPPRAHRRALSPPLRQRRVRSCLRPLPSAPHGGHPHLFSSRGHSAPPGGHPHLSSSSGHPALPGGHPTSDTSSTPGGSLPLSQDSSTSSPDTDSSRLDDHPSMFNSQFDPTFGGDLDLGSRPGVSSSTPLHPTPATYVHTPLHLHQPPPQHYTPDSPPPTCNLFPTNNPSHLLHLTWAYHILAPYADSLEPTLAVCFRNDLKKTFAHMSNTYQQRLLEANSATNVLTHLLKQNLLTSSPCPPVPPPASSTPPPHPSPYVPPPPQLPPASPSSSSPTPVPSSSPPSTPLLPTPNSFAGVASRPPPANPPTYQPPPRHSNPNPPRRPPPRSNRGNPFHIVITQDPSACTPIDNNLGSKISFSSLNTPSTQITNIFRARNKITLHTNSKNSMDSMYAKLKNATNGTNISVNLPPTFKPRFTLFNLPNTIPLSDLPSLLTQSVGSTCKLVRTFTGRNNSTHAVIETDNDTATQIQSRPRLFLGYNSIRFDRTRSTHPCRNCGDIRHRNDICNKPPKCLHCGEGHITNNCPATGLPPKCFRCNGNGQHRADSLSCPFAQSSHIDILLLQELPVRNNALPSPFPTLSSSLLHAPISNNRCNTCIVVLNQSLPVIFLPRLSTTNRTLAILDIPGFHLTICSVYFPHNKSFSPIVDSFISLFGSPPPPRLLFAGDVNAVSSRWSSKKQNSKGSFINILLDTLDLKVCNTWGAITRSQGSRSSSIDISSVSSSLLSSISGWTSCPTDLSDHFEIRFSLSLPPDTIPSSPPPPPSPFPGFSSISLPSQPPLPLFNSLAKSLTNSGSLHHALDHCNSPDSLDTLLQSFYSTLFIKCSRHLRPRPPSSNFPPPRPLLRRSAQNSSPPNRSTLQSQALQAKKNYTRALFKAKRDHFRKLCSSFNRSPWGPIHRYITRGSSRSLPLSSDSFQKSLLHCFFNSCFSAGHFPSLWKTGRLILLPKRSTSTDLIQKSRPIILLPILGKLLESLMAFRLTHHFESNNLLHPLQFGFRRRRSTIDALSLLHNKIKRAVRPSTTCGTPLSLADLLPPPAPPSLLQLYRSFLSNRTIHLSYRGFSRSTSPSRGCAQGSVSGPLLWNIFFNPLLSLSFPPGVHVQAFADDLQLLISGPPSSLPSLAQSSLDLIHSWCLDNKLSLSPHKSLVLPIFCNPPHLTIDNTPLTCPDTLTILGVTFDERLSFTPHLHRVCDKASSFLGRLSRCSNTISGLGYVARRRFYCSVVEPAITYAAPIWCEAVKYRIGKASLRSLQRKFCVHAIRGFRTVPTLTAIALLRVLPLDLKVLLLSSLLRPPDPLPFTPESPPSPFLFPSPPLLPDLSFSLLPPSAPDLDYYTDGSKSRSGVGAGVARFSSSPLSSCFPPLCLSIPLASHCSVFQAECFAFRSALSDLCNLPLPSPPPSPPTVSPSSPLSFPPTPLTPS